MISFKPVDPSADMLARYEALFSASFSRMPKFGLSALRWLYVDNPEGPAVGFDAWDGDILAAHYVCVPTRMRIHGTEVRSLLSLNTATHPAYQGQGLFPKLAGLTFEAGTGAGFHSAFGVANANSTHAAVKKLGYRFVASLQAMLGVGSMAFDVTKATGLAGFERVWSPRALQWRCNNPVNPVSMHRASDRLVFQAKAVGPVVVAQAELPLLQTGLEIPTRHVFSPVKLHLGLLPQGTGGFSSYVNIPHRLRPSPLNLMYRPLAGTDSRIEGDSVHFNFLDFDAY